LYQRRLLDRRRHFRNAGQNQTGAHADDAGLQGWKD
jgi:hypothetical protein